MKIFSLTHRTIVFSMAFVVLAFQAGQAGAQTESKAPVPVPETEKFVAVDELAVPWIRTGCGVENRLSLDSDCHLHTAEEFDWGSWQSLYNADGTVWTRYNITLGDPNHYSERNISEFSPLAFMGPTKPGSWGTVMRLVGVSPNWYEVEINERSRKTKYISKEDKSWARVTWEYWWRSDPRIRLDPGMQVYDKPDGSPVEIGMLKIFRFESISGDWAKVLGRPGPLMEIHGWVRWRSGRDILIKCVFNTPLSSR